MRPPLFETPASIFLVVLVQGFLSLFLFLALIYGVGELALFCVILHATGLFAFLWSRLGLEHTFCDVRLDRSRVFPGEKVNIRIQMTNSKPIPALIKVDLFLPGSVVGAPLGYWMREERGLLWYQQAVISREFSPPKRGVYDLGPPLLRAGDLFGFFSKQRVGTRRLALIVYPRIADIRKLSVPKRDFYGVPGSRSPVEDPVYVFGTRDYQPGRPARGIHWKASARHHRLQEKLFEPAEQEKVLILLDVDQFQEKAKADDFEKILEVIASIVVQLNRRGIAVGFATNGLISGGGSRIVPISGGFSKAPVILETLARVDAQKTDTMAGILSKGYRIPWGVSCLYFAADQSSQTRDVKAFLNKKNILVQFVFAQHAVGSEAMEKLREKDILWMKDLLPQELSQT